MPPLHSAVLATLALLSTAPALAGNFVVNQDGDAPDFIAGDGICDILPPGVPAPPVCTLRAAIMQANASTDVSTVVIPGGFHIVLTDHLPLVNEPLTVTGPAASDVAALPVIDGDDSFLPFGVFATEATIRNLRIVNGLARPNTDGGGALLVNGLATVLVENVQFHGNQAVGSVLGGGAILNYGTLDVVRSDFEENTATGNGGAIFHTGASPRELTIRDSSIRRTRTGAATGEAVYVDSGAELLFVNTLIDGSDNQPGATESGGILAEGAELIELNNATLVNFTRRALQVEAENTGVLAVYNSILADSDAGDCVIGNASGATIEFNYNLIGDDTCAIFSGDNIVTGDPGLSLLQTDDGSFVRYRMPQFPGAAVDAASPGPDSACENTDQRGTPRPLDDDGDGVARCDLGAIEGTNPLTSVFPVGTSVDSVDDNPGDGVCANSAGSCSLRAAVMEANAKPGPDVIRFNPINMTLTRADAGDASGGDLDITEALLIDGSFGSNGRPLTFLAQTVPGERHFEVNAPADQHVVFRGLRLSGGSTTNVSGGSLRITGGADVSIDRVELMDNQSDDVGGAVSLVNGTLAVDGSDFHHNRTGSTGPALYVGGDGTAIVRASSFWANEDSDPLRDTIYVAPGGELALSNSTVAFNDGGVTGFRPSALTIDQSTIAFNEDGGVRVFFNDAGIELFRLSASILAGNGVGDCAFVLPELADQIELDLWNLVQDGSACSVGASNLVTDPMLSFAQGPTPLYQPPGQLSRVLLPNAGPSTPSPALDRVPAGPNCLDTDQLGLSRPQDLPWLANGDGPCDIGAVEIDADDRIFADGFED